MRRPRPWPRLRRPPSRRSCRSWGRCWESASTSRRVPRSRRSVDPPAMPPPAPGCSATPSAPTCRPCRPRPTTSPGTRSVATTAAGRSPARSRRPSGRVRRGSPTTCRATTSPPTTTTPGGWSATSSLTCPRPPSTSTTSSRPGSGGWPRSPPTSCRSATTRSTWSARRRPTPIYDDPLRDTSGDLEAEPAEATGAEAAEAAQVEAPHHRRPVQEARPGVGAELGRDHVRRRRPVGRSDRGAAQARHLQATLPACPPS